MGWTVGGIILGVVIVALAIGIPYFYTHKRMREPYDAADSRDYLRARRGWWRFHWLRASQRRHSGATGPLPPDPPLISEPTSAQPDSRTPDAGNTAP